MYINFQQNRANRSVITVHTKVFAKNLQLAIRISKNHAFRTCTTPSRTFRPILKSIGLLDNELPRKEIISTDDRRRARVRGLEWTENRLLRGLLSVFLLFYALRGPSRALRGRST